MSRHTHARAAGCWVPPSANNWPTDASRRVQTTGWTSHCSTRHQGQQGSAASCRRRLASDLNCWNQPFGPRSAGHSHRTCGNRAGGHRVPASAGFNAFAKRRKAQYCSLVGRRLTRSSQFSARAASRPKANICSFAPRAPVNSSSVARKASRKAAQLREACRRARNRFGNEAGTLHRQGAVAPAKRDSPASAGGGAFSAQRAKRGRTSRGPRPSRRSAMPKPAPKVEWATHSGTRAPTCPRRHGSAISARRGPRRRGVCMDAHWHRGDNVSIPTVSSSAAWSTWRAQPR